MKNSNDIRIDKGMSVDVVDHIYNPVTTKGGQIVANAFM